jgi:hypothetical protein
MGRTTILIVAAAFGLCTATLAHSAETPKDPAPETAPQTSATTSVKAPAGVTDPNAAQNAQTGINNAKTGCKSASAEMTNGATESCKQ